MPRSNLPLRFRPQERSPRQPAGTYTQHIEPCHRLIGHFRTFLFRRAFSRRRRVCSRRRMFARYLCLLHESHTGGIVRVLRSGRLLTVTGFFSSGFFSSFGLGFSLVRILPVPFSPPCPFHGFSVFPLASAACPVFPLIGSNSASSDCSSSGSSSSIPSSSDSGPSQSPSSSACIR